jgi:glycosyltransferase involved in cell wall biosynthesis
MTIPKVSILIITYNHARFIAKAVESVLEQITRFSVEINILDDCSTDGTSDILRDFKRRFPDKINLTINEKNIGNKVTQRNFIKGFKTLKGDFIAILEGDDYWDNPNKLQRQVDYLEANPGYVATAHNVLKVYEDSDKDSHLFLPPPEGRDVFNIDDVIYLRVYCHTSTLVYRNVLRDNVPEKFSNPYSCDLFILAAHAEYGDIKFFSDTMSVYRNHKGGGFSNLTEVQGWIFNIEGMIRYNRWLKYRHAAAYTGAIYRYCDYMLENGAGSPLLTPYIKLKYWLISMYYKKWHRRLPARQ